MTSNLNKIFYVIENLIIYDIFITPPPKTQTVRKLYTSGALIIQNNLHKKCASDKCATYTFSKSAQAHDSA